LSATLAADAAVGAKTPALMVWRLHCVHCIVLWNPLAASRGEFELDNRRPSTSRRRYRLHRSIERLIEGCYRIRYLLRAIRLSRALVKQIASMKRELVRLFCRLGSNFAISLFFWTMYIDSFFTTRK